MKKLEALKKITVPEHEIVPGLIESKFLVQPHAPPRADFTVVLIAPAFAVRRGVHGVICVMYACAIKP